MTCEFIYHHSLKFNKYIYIYIYLTIMFILFNINYFIKAELLSSIDGTCHLTF
jgi:hypothetical protein